MTKISEPIRWALAALALANIGIGLVLIGTVGHGPVATLFRDIVGWMMIFQAIPGALQAWFGKLHRTGEEMLVANAGLIAFATWQIAATGNAPDPVATWGEGILVVTTGIGCILLWGRLTGRRLGEEFRQEREARRKERA